MNYERNKKYFSQHLSTLPIIISAACFGLGFLMVVILANTRGIPGYIMTPAGLTLIAVGAFIFIVRSARKIPDGEISEQTGKLYETFQEDFNQKFIPQDIRTIRYEMLNHISRPKLEPITFATYCFEGEDVLAKKGNDGKCRSSIYSMSGFILKPD